MDPRKISHLLAPRRTQGAPPEQWPRPVRADETFRVLAVCAPGRVEEQLRGAARGLGQDIGFVRSFPAALRMVGERHYDIVVVSKMRDGMSARDFVRDLKKINGDAVVVIAAPCAEYEQLIEAMVEGAYDFLPDDADRRQFKLMLGRAMDHSRLRRKSGELERALDVQTSALRQRLQELAMLNEMSQDMSAVPDLDEVLRRALRRALDAFGSECGSFMILDPETDELVVRAADGPGAEQLIGMKRKLGEGISGKVARERHPVLVTDIENDSRFRFEGLAQSGSDRYRSPSFIAVPLIHHNRLLGELNIAEKTSGEPFTQDDLRLLSILGGHVASAINGALAAEELKKANESLREKMYSARESLRATNEKLSKAEGLAQAVASSLPAGVAAFDSDLKVTFANDTAKDLLGLEQDGSLKGHPAWSDMSALADAAAEVAESGSTKKLTTGGHLQDCRSGACVNIVVAPLRLPDGSVSGGTIVATPGDCPLIRPMEEKETPQ